MYRNLPAAIDNETHESWVHQGQQEGAEPGPAAAGAAGGWMREDFRIEDLQSGTDASTAGDGLGLLPRGGHPGGVEARPARALD